MSASLSADMTPDSYFKEEYKLAALFATAMGDPVVSITELSSKSYNLGLFKRVLQSPSDKIAEGLVNQYLVFNCEELKPCLAALIAAHKAEPLAYKRKSKTFLPLVKKYLEWLVSQQPPVSKDKAGKKKKEKIEDWRFPDATFEGRPDIEAFLHSPARKKIIEGFQRPWEAKDFVKKHLQKCTSANIVNGRLTMAVTGKGKKSVVRLRKVPLIKNKTRRIKGPTDSDYVSRSALKRLLPENERKACRAGLRRFLGIAVDKDGMDDTASNSASSSDEEEREEQEGVGNGHGAASSSAALIRGGDAGPSSGQKRKLSGEQARSTASGSSSKKKQKQR